MSYREAYERWLNSPALSAEEKAELQAIAGDEKEIESRFFAPLDFGTAGLRGTMFVGLHNMNIHVIRHATQAFAEVILEEGPEAVQKGVAVCYDSRNHSEEFAHEVCSVMAANGIPSRVMDALRPTPELSFAIREYGCIAGVNVTASHNPKEYNGYKVYWADGAQLPPHHASAIAAKMAKNDVFDSVKRMDFDEAVKAGLVTIMGKDCDEAFLKNVMGQLSDPDIIPKVADKFKVVYTPFHGTGHKLIPEALKRAGLKHLFCEPQQMVIDGNFPTVKSPNPENPEGFYLAVELANKEGADFIIGSDPDADRIGLMVRGTDGNFVVLTGNQTGVLMLDYLIQAKRRLGILPSNAVSLKTIVSSEMARKICEVNGVQMFDTFTGFKFIAEKKNALEETGEGKVFFSFEESYGYMLGDYVRDKDAVTAALVATEMAAYYYDRGMTLYDALQELYAKYGQYGEKTLNLVMPGLDGLQKMAKLMADLRAVPPTEIAGVPVELRRDYSTGIEENALTGEKTEMELKNSNVLKYKMTDGNFVVVRPSGTEPKVKVYILALGDTREACDAKVAAYCEWAETLRK